jgi:CRISPR-associated exonuclease Cas4
MIPALAILLIVLAVVLLWQAARQQRAAGLPGGRVIYSDTRQWGPVEKPLFDAGLHLVGKPDYLVQQGDMIIPIEVKSGEAPSAPHDSHIYQLAAYCLLVERAHGKRPAYGILHYRNRSFAIDYTPVLEAKLMEVLADMRRVEKSGNADRSHDQASRCARCGFRQACDQRL